ncbi:hypothetical protein J1P26_22115 [Neobacillus sp. MM2021_6]|uniref:hypothetical protein n=1 Tax=Bacillaceae TaxID=186817 RepID=UPI001407DD10|nr:MULTISPECIES: hypothetical protein [Bacillaceae]MBO0962401.1 hypothetical protein [Neobacillus sp. MM2021_6]NHC21030.1 hypothetical protein [Bacillus sp. MM2020_4]
MSKKIINKSVSFNVIDPFQRQMKDYADQYPNFSAYIKRLIQRDMEEGTKVKSIKKAPAQPSVIQGGTNAFTGFVLGQNQAR